MMAQYIFANSHFLKQDYSCEILKSPFLRVLALSTMGLLLIVMTTKKKIDIDAKEQYLLKHSCPFIIFIYLVVCQVYLLLITKIPTKFNNNKVKTTYLCPG